MPQAEGRRSDVLFADDSGAGAFQGTPERLLRMLECPLGVLKSLPGALVPAGVILFPMSYRGASMSMRSDVVQLGGSLMILVMGCSILGVIRHLEGSYFPGLVVRFLG